MDVVDHGFSRVRAGLESRIAALSGRIGDHLAQDLGRSAGLLLQIIDDIHDFTLSGDVAGKEPGRDFYDGRLTLPGILAMDDEAARPEFMRLWSSERTPETFSRLLELLRGGGYLEASREKAREIMAGMLPCVEDLPVRESARELRGFMEVMFHREF